ncbi:MAG TPA: glycoside hydrolase family 9 protein [Armatimonadota bacterium]|nr:glycoside hydrolase family 9 protein [Armatimonadota bacterium]HOM80583.1 glycoside hydrolase family 9 protein [Armatimonadota bacterium]HPO73894.1 glycoside hydrolase family 9 protein [Armatimonadota bacterium]
MSDGMSYARLFRVLLLLMVPVAAVSLIRHAGAESSASIVVDQAGYAPDERKLAFVTGATGRFSVVDPRGRVVFSGALEPAGHAVDAGKNFTRADFTPLKTPGVYMIRLPGGARSPRFRIDSRAHDEVMQVAIRAFRAQECGTAVRLGLPQDHPACHLEDGTLWEERERRIPSVGGWHDAGDYGKYTVNGAYAAGLLLTLAERRQGDLARSLLEVTRCELEWLLTMQARDGAAYHKLTAVKHPGVLPPEGDRSQRYLFPVSSTATGDLAAAMAIAARAYAPVDAGFSRRCLEAAKGAWRWLEAHPEPLLFRNPQGVNTGEYGDKDDRDERLWAAVEIYRTTGDEAALRRFRELAEPRRPAFTYAGSWGDVANVALLSFLQEKRVDEGDPLRARIQRDLISFGRSLAARCARHPLGVVLTPKDYYWGSNGIALTYALLLLEAGRHARDGALIQAGRDQVHYVLGRNALGISFVTGVGERCVRNPHHAPSILTRGQPALPGLLVGGPNHRQAKPLSEFPATAYVDDPNNWTVNEPAINLNAELVLALGLMDSWEK